MTSRPLTRTFWTLVKLGVCGTSILLVGWAILVFEGTDGQEASADILALGPVPLSNTAKFENSLDALDHSEPRSYDFNGNEIAFSTNYTDKHPRRIIAEYQRQFVRHGLNEESYATHVDPDDPEARKKLEAEQRKQRTAMLSGQPVPLTIGESYASMGAAMVAGKPDTRHELKNRVARPAADSAVNFFEGYRLIEVFRESGSTSVTASWSRGEFEMEKHFPSRQAGARTGGANGHVPSCTGCLQMMQFAGRSNAAPNALNVFGTDQHEQQVTDFYDQKMADRGWRQAPSSRLMKHMMPHAAQIDGAATFRQYQRGDERLSLGIRPHPALDKTLVTTYQSR